MYISHTSISRLIEKYVSFSQEVRWTTEMQKIKEEYEGEKGQVGLKMILVFWIDHFGKSLNMTIREYV